MNKKTIKIEYELPPILPTGWRKEVARIMKVHRNTVYNILQEGESHPRYAELMNIAKINFGKPVKTTSL